MNAILQYLEDEEKKLAAAIKEFFAGLRAHPDVQAVAEPPADFSPAPPAGEPAPVALPAEAPAAAVPVAQPPGGNTTDPTAPGFIPPAQPVQPVPAAPTEPTVDTSADTLDFDAVRGRPIDLADGVAKTIVNCPATVMVGVNQASGQSGAHNSYTATVNDVPHFMPNVQAQFLEPVSGPKVVVSVDSPGLQLEVQPG